jgi:hypothetical protein
MGVDDRDNFDTSDLFEDKNLNQVRICLLNLGRAAYLIDGYQGPCLGKPIKAASGGKHAVVKTTGLWGKGALLGNIRGSRSQRKADVTFTR